MEPNGEIYLITFSAMGLDVETDTIHKMTPIIEPDAKPIRIRAISEVEKYNLIVFLIISLFLKIKDLLFYI
jgi:hypothetical protein